ncbi:Mitochondrial intermembrane space import and assembly protein 40 [Escovopsis weberi]|uniref:Mitochondrial intermembrane space import and assembly protein 40 n=1 Tax=Escovopsis weberi TaxID=150374 RepID=A0A0M8N8X6_ESCWE|nr:Mitochondrial intermembrane space import and assembly protein 40 [Escovopsis weberi]
MRPASRPALNTLRSSVARAAPRRFASTAPPADKPRTWKSSAARWALAAAGVYYYNVNSTFADDLSSQTLAQSMYPESEPHTVESLVEQRRLQSATKKPLPREAKSMPEAADNEKPPRTAEIESDNAKAPAQEPEKEPDTQAHATAAVMSPTPPEEEAGQDGAFNPETGEINWDCPCLGGMAHGPCGEEFKTAFSCFVYSTEEPKGMDCIEKFQAMQECFRKYPEVYGSELEDDGEAGAEEGAAGAATASGKSDAAPAAAVPEPMQSFEPVAEPASSGEPPLAEHQTLRQDHPVGGKKADGQRLAAAAQRGEGTVPWTDNTKANEKK